MRIVRVIVGVLLLTLGVPALVVGGAYWVAGPPPPDGGSALRVADPAVALVVLAVGALALAAGALALAAAHRPVVVVAEPADAAALAARLGVRLLESHPVESRPVATPSGASRSPALTPQSTADNPPPTWPLPADRPATLADAPKPAARRADPSA